MSDTAFKDNVVIITGASTGIGRALALQLADQGARLALAARSRVALEAVAAECRARGGKAMAVVTDVTKEAACKKLVAATVAEYGRIDTLVNNAGVSMWARFDGVNTPRILDAIMQVNYMGSVNCTYHALPYLKQTRGRIVAFSSLAGKAGVPLRSGYAASKHAVGGFFDSLRIEMEGSGVSVTVIYPGFVATEGRERAFGPDGKALGRGNSPVREDEAMPAQECARLALRAMARRQREEVMTLRGKVGLWIKLIAPGLVDRIARQAIEAGK